jgi:hypothetical protein
MVSGLIIGLIVISVIALGLGLGLGLGLKKSSSSPESADTSGPQWCDRCLTNADCPESDTGFCCPHLKKCLENSSAGCITIPTSAGCDYCPDSADFETCECSNSDFPDKWVGYNSVTQATFQGGTNIETCPLKD